MPEFEDKNKGLFTVDLIGLARRDMNVMIATPMDSGVSAHFVVSLLKLFLYFREVGIKANWMMIPNDSLITRARNTLTAMFLANPEFTHMFWIDSDLTFEPSMVETILLKNYEVSGAAYPLKTHDFEMMAKASSVTNGNLTNQDLEKYASKFVINTITEEMVEKAKNCDDPRDVFDPNKTVIQEGFTKVAELGTGFLCVRRSAYIKMCKMYNNDWYSTDMPSLKDLDQKLQKLGIHVFYTFYDTMIWGDTRRYLSEDYAFCQKYRKMGGDVHCLVDATFKHAGPHEFGGNYLQFLLSQQKLGETEFKSNQDKNLAFLNQMQPMMAS